VTAERSGMDRVNHLTVELSLADVRDLLDADVIWCPDPTIRIAGIVAADLMSDVLVDSRPGALLLTGLSTVQAVRTAAIADLAGVVFVRGKRPPDDAVAVAREEHVPVFVTSQSLFAAAGTLYAARSAPHPATGVPAHG